MARGKGKTRSKEPGALPTGGTRESRRIAGAISAYRGYRRQALYALHRLLELADGERLQPEGVEDLSVIAEGRLVEANQVKSYAVPLTLSHLEPAAEGSFFQAAAARSRRGERERLRLISFGPLGPELAGVRDGDEQKINAVVAKLGEAGIDAATARELTDRLDIVEVDEKAVAAAVRERLGAMPTGADPDAAFELLTLWIYTLSEHRATVTSSDARKRVEAVAAVISSMRAHHEEWNVTIVPIGDVEVTPDRRAALENEFYQGVSVRFEHVAAGLPVDRPNLLEKIDQAFERDRVVVIHAASGQGKTTLAYQFLACLPSSWRFRIAAVPDRFHALRMATALEGHAATVGLPVYVHLDVSPQDVAWPTLARELASNEHLRVLVTIREEDWRRSSDIAVIPFAEVDPTLTSDEARDIYQALRSRFPDAPPTFEEAWTRFGGEGPLLEFVYLVTQRQELRARLSDQVRRLRTEAQSTGTAAVDFLRLASVIAATGARAELAPLASVAGLQDAAHIVSGMEREYLLRRSDDGRLVGGLHPIRSQILTELLTDPALSPIGEQLASGVQLVTEPDLEIFMLRALSSDGADVEGLRGAALSRDLATWSGYAGIARAIRWRGIADYAELHRDLIEEVDPGHSGRWTVVLNTDIAGAMPGGIDEIWARLAETLPRAAGVRDAVRAFQARQRPANEALAPLKNWLTQARQPPAPTTSADWTAFAEMYFFSARLGSLVEPVWLTVPTLDGALEAASVTALADLSLALFEGDHLAARGHAWLDRHRHALIQRYREATGAIGLHDDGETIAVDFIVAAAGQGEDAEPASRSYNSQAVTRLDQLRRLIPDRERYGSQGWGHRVEGVPYDGTEKRIPRGSLPPLWLTSLNATFRGYVELWWRPGTWTAYRDDLAAFRRETCERLEAISVALERFHRGAAGLPVQGTANEEWFKDWAAALEVQALLPRVAVDEFGFTDESSAMADPTKEGAIAARSLALSPYLGFVKSRRELTRTLRNFADQAPKVMAYVGAIGRASPGTQDSIHQKAAELGIADLPRLSTLNLGDALKALPAFQSGAAALFGSPELVGLVERERRAFLRAFGLWRFFTQSPRARVNDLSVQVARHQREFVESWKQTLVAQLRGLDADTACRVDEHTEPEGGRLVVTVSGEDAVAVYGLLEPVVRTISQALSNLGAEDLALVEAQLPRTLIVPLVWDKSLRSEAVSFSTLVIGAESWEPQWWHFAPHPIPDDLATAYRVWDDPELQLGNRLADGVAGLFAMTTHLLDLPARGDLDDLGMSLLEAYVARIDPSPAALLTGAAGHIEMLAGAVAALADTEPYRDDLAETLGQLRNVITDAPRWERGVIPEAALRDWKPRIEHAVGVAAAVRLAWSTVVLARSRL